MPGEFDEARRALEGAIAELHTFSQQIREHGEIEKKIGERGNEIMRLLMHGYLDRAAQAEEKLAHVEGADGRQRRYEVPSVFRLPEGVLYAASLS